MTWIVSTDDLEVLQSIGCDSQRQRMINLLQLLRERASVHFGKISSAECIGEVHILAIFVLEI